MVWTLIRFFFVTFPIFVTMAIFGILTWHVRSERWKTTYRKLAVRFGGRIDSFGWRPRLLFDYRGMQVTLVNQGVWFAGRQPRTLFQLDFESRGVVELSVTPKGWPNFAKPRKHLKNVDGLDEKLVQSYEFASSDPAVAGEMLSRQWLENLQEMTYRFPKELVALDLGPRRLRIVRSGFIRDDTELSDFVRYCLKFVDLMQFSQVEGIEFCGELESAISADARCPVCAEQPRGLVVVCVSCKTPHCYDCWQYNGRCGMFACGETRYFRAE
ncbi:MAG: hypothetical protein KF851_06760 [Pirellulaceae bacterium]|jgi:hypothetical protein|nr:hypothetical protein [Pirellulaceae bacterium]